MEYCPYGSLKNFIVRGKGSMVQENVSNCVNLGNKKVYFRNLDNFVLFKQIWSHSWKFKT